MFWFFAFLLLAIFLCIKFPTFRKFTFGAIGLLLVVIIFVISKERIGESYSKTLIPFDEIKIDIQLARDFNSSVSSKITGEIQNNSAHTLTNVLIDVTAYDCPSSVIDSDCRIVGEDKGVDISSVIPPNQVRAVDEYVYLGNMPPFRGRFLWSYEIVETRGR